MLMDREVIRNEALLLLTYLTREAEEILKILVFEGAFEKFFSIIKEEGGSECGVVVQDCLELLNNLLRNNSSNQVLWKWHALLYFGYSRLPLHHDGDGDGDLDLDVGGAAFSLQVHL
ncbi:golgin candidate 6-like isoform X2 [Rutidosis leptorrhynchoides]|uniref:golgin candidate 6-like isoform X2 n=1 Tax=Rutidosis leptorrhynchoides TaxID=125765 RepID=UPI003A994194